MTSFPRFRTVAAAAAALALAGGAHGQQPTNAPEAARSNRGDRTERIGPTMWRVRPQNTPYDRWFAKAKATMPTFEGLVIQDARTVALKPWPDKGVDGLYVKMADYQITDGWILEIPPKGSTKPQRHMFEAGMYFFGGPGHIIIQQEGKRPQQVDFKYRTLFSVPLNVRYQIFNTGDKPVRVMAVTSFPFVMNSTDSEKFVFENPFQFNDRYDAEEDFLRRSRQPRERLTVTNLVPDALEFKLDRWDARGKGTTNMHWTMSGNTQIDLHVSEMPAKVYKRAHRHSSDAFILLLSGKGYSLTWPEGQYEKRVRVDWQEGTMFVPPIYWYHQHLNPGTESARYLAINAPVIVSRLGLRFEDQLEPDLPQIKADFEKEAGVKVVEDADDDSD
jgi:mannose-6-phosphate isomerase-like protein (cupin superfamily)